jgi:hypothetical protein
MAGLPGDGVGIPGTNQVVVSTSIDVLDEQGFNIGFVTRIDRRDARPVERIRHLNAEDAGRTVEMTPSPEGVTLDVTGFYIYPKSALEKRSLLNRLPQSVDGAASFRSLNSQKIPFVIVERTRHPATNVESKTTYVGCWLTAFSRPINIGTATVAETATVEVQAVV